MKPLSYYPLCITYHLIQLLEDHPCSRTMSLSREVTILHMMQVCKKDSKKNLGNDKPKRVNKHMESRNLVEVVCLDFQNAFDKVSL